MKVSTIALFTAVYSARAFAPQFRVSRSTFLQGYLDDLTQELYGEDPNPNPDEESREATQMKKEDVSNFGAGSWEGYVEFDEFDGGDGQMGVAGDGNKKLEKFDNTEIAKSKSMSAKNAWGTSTGYADTLVAKGVDTARAQQLENWHNQQEVLGKRKQQRFMTDDFDQVGGEREDENWRELAKFGVERNQEFDMDEAFGAVEIGEVEGVIELQARMNGPAAVHEFGLKNPYMGFADFRAAFTDDSGVGLTVSPAEGSLMQREETVFNVKFKAQSPGAVEGYLVIETEDFKKTWKVMGTTA